MTTALRFIAFAFLLSIVACAHQAPAEPAASSTDIRFQITPEALSAAAHKPASLAGQGQGGPSADPRPLIYNSELAVETVSATFLPNKTLRLEVSFRNVTTELTFEQPFSFSVDRAQNFVSSSEPTVTDADLGGDGKLSPGEVSAKLTFEIVHKNQPFIYTVVAKSVVTSPSSVEVDIPDPTLQRAVRDALGKPSGPLTRADLLQLETLSVAPPTGPEDTTGPEDRVKRVDGLQYATNLRTLELPEQRFELEPLANLTRLETLDISGTFVDRDTQFGEGIRDLTPLAGLTGLKVLNIAGNPLDSFAPVAGFSALESLTAYNTDIDDPEDTEELRFIASLGKLRFLDISENPFTDFTPLLSSPSLGSLKTLNLSYTLLDEKAQQDVATLRAQDIEVSTEGLGFSSLVEDAGVEFAIREELNKPYGRLTKDDLSTLSKLGVSYDFGVGTLQGLQYATNLRSLGVSNAADISAIAGLKSLRRLSLYNVGGVKVVSTLNNLESLSASLVGDDLSFVTGLSKLKTLEFTLSFASDASPLATLEALETLVLENTQISDISALSELPALNVLDLRGNQISDISPLVTNSGVGEGDSVRLEGNPLNEQSEQDIATLRARGVTVTF